MKTETSVFDTIEGSNSVLERTVVKENNKPVVESDPWGDLFGSPSADTTTERTKSTRSTSDDFSFDDILGVDSPSSDNKASEEENRAQAFLKKIPSKYDYMLKPIDITEISLLAKQ